MKTSKYNYVIEKGDKIYCFNAITRMFFKMNRKHHNIVNEILTNPESCSVCLPAFYQKLIDGGFIINDTIDELNTIRELNVAACNSKDYLLTILPTIDCNFRCWYCYEQHKRSEMSTQTMERIKKYIVKIATNKDANSLNIEWFGGEPFLYFDKVIKPITEFAKRVCDENNKLFTCGATTNGFLITSTIANELKEMGIERFQITLDGERSHHDKTRVAKGVSSFDTILQNVNYICNANKKARILLRINYDNENFYPEIIFNQVKERIEKGNQDQIAFMLRKVWQVEKVDEGNDKALKFISLIKKTAFKYSYLEDLSNNFIPCYATIKNMKLITPEGSICKCTTKNDFEKEALGTLTEDGSIKWNNDLPFDDIYATPLFENKKCLNCKQLPLCMGACPKYINNDGTISHLEECKGKVNDFNVIDLITNYCEAVDTLN